MKKTSLLLLSISLFVSGLVSGQTQVFIEDFENGMPSSWSVHIEDNHTTHSSVSAFAPGWISVTDPDDSSDTVVGATSYFDPAGTANRWLITPSISLSDYGNILKWKAKSHDASFADSYFILLSESGANPEDFTDTIAAIGFENSYWTNREVNLSDSGYNNVNVHFAFVLASTDAFILYLNDIEVINDDPAKVFELKEEPKITVSEGEIRFLEHSPEQLQAFDLSGREIAMEPISSKRYSTNYKGVILLTYFVNGKWFRDKKMMP